MMGEHKKNSRYFICFALAGLLVLWGMETGFRHACAEEPPGPGMDMPYELAGDEIDDEIVIEDMDEDAAYPPPDFRVPAPEYAPPPVVTNANLPSPGMNQPEADVPHNEVITRRHDKNIVVSPARRMFEEMEGASDKPVVHGKHEYTAVMAKLEKMFKSNNDKVPAIFKEDNGLPMVLPDTILEKAPARTFILNRLGDKGINVLINPDIKCNVSMMLKDVTLWTAITRVLDTCGLGWKINGTIFQVDTLDRFNEVREKRAMVIRPYYLKYLKAEEVKKFLIGETTVKSTNLIVGENGYTGGNTNNQDTAREDQGLINTWGNTDEEYPSVVADESTNCVIIKDKAENVERIVTLLDAMDVPRPQIKIQTWIVETNQQTAQEIGMRWSAMWKIGNTDFFSGSRDLYDGSQSQFRYPLEGIGRGVIPPQPQSSGQNGVYRHDVNNREYNGRLYSLGVAASGSAGAFVAEMQALESTGALRVLSRPELVLQDNREATITQGQDIYKSYFSTYYQGSQRINAKLEVTVKPHITPGGSLIIDVMLKDRWPNEALSTERNTVINEKGIETRLFVADGQTVVLGGIRHAKQDNSEDGVPVLKDIPILGKMFSYKSDRDELQELLLILRPVILSASVQAK